MTRPPVILLGAGGHAGVVAATLRAMGRPIAGCMAPEPPAESTLRGIDYLGTDGVLDSLIHDNVELVVAVGSIAASHTRLRLYEKAANRGFRFATIMHPTAIVDPSARLGRAVQIMAGAIVQAGTEIGDNAIINSGAIVEHGCRIGQHVHVASGAVIAGDVSVGANSHIGAGAVVLQGCKIGETVTIGAAACVTQDVESGTTVVGVPARARARRSGNP